MRQSDSNSPQSTQCAGWSGDQWPLRDRQVLPRNWTGNLRSALDISSCTRTKNNHDATVQFLHHNRKEGCSREAMEDTIRNDDFALLKRLCEHRGEGSLEGGIQFAAKHGQVKFVKYLFQALSTDTVPSFVPREELVNHAAMNGNLELIRFFHEHAYFRFSARAMHNAAISNYLHVVKFLHENCTEGCKVDMLFECNAQIVDFFILHRPMDNLERVIARAKKEG